MLLVDEAKSVLSDRAIAARLADFNPDGSLGDRLGAIWSRCGAMLLDVSAQHYRGIAVRLGLPDDEATIASYVDLQRLKYTSPIDEHWIRRQAGLGSLILAHKVATPRVVYWVSSLGIAINERIATDCAADPAFVAESNKTLHWLGHVELELMFAELVKRERMCAAASRSDEGRTFRNHVAGVLSSAQASAATLRAQTEHTSSSARGMLGKASEVAAAAEQSAVAMREAAQTAAGLIRAIEVARSEVEASAGVASRAADQSALAVQVADALSGHAQAIESILGLIRDIAGQTNLLALNATIEAARAGDAGRGFAVVAQEVKSLASQTARATDDIAAKIAAIQSASRQTLDVNGAIRDIVGEVQSSAQRIREAMETQAQTVTMITAAVDETALAADSMSGTIAAIRADTETVAADIDRLEVGFAQVDGQLAGLDATTGDFVARIAG